MEYIGDVFYEYGGGLYANLTNKCPCRCEFCIRDMVGALGGADSLWLRREPTLEEIKELLGEWDLNEFDELVFCGYGEPTERLEDLLATARYAKSLSPALRVRINTNGLSDLINKRDTTEDLRGIIDAVSISLNAKGPEEYLALCHPRFGIDSFDAIIDYTRRVKEVVPDVTMSIVGGTIPRQDERPCREIAESLGVKFRIR
ncbi:MAG: radical SAM protein [Firmicutes bacterium]|jgi:TatD family-associated radical SAM protein|nr:radical SAM protein [Bacillota bacterium]